MQIKQLAPQLALDATAIVELHAIDPIVYVLYLSNSLGRQPVRDKEGKLVKKIGNAGKPVVLYRGLPKLLQTLKNSDLLKYVRHDRSKTETSTETTQSKSN